MYGIDPKIKYFLYARKSSESEDRQVQSIDDQVNRLEKLAQELGLTIKEVLTESKSAKKPDNRPIFNEMMERIEQGEADGILCWQINRLSRNPIDSAKISWMLQQKVIKSIQTVDRQYLPDDNVLLWSVESGMANQYILDLRKNVKRGMDSKVQKGWYPVLAPLGYLNEQIERIIVKDPERFDLVRRMWDLMLTGNYTPPQILDIANNEWGFRTRKFKRIGGNKLSRSGIYKIFTNIFYTGIIDYAGKQYEGKHEPIITLEEFDRVQLLLGRKGKPRPQKHDFSFTGFIKCAECECLYTAETKKKIIKSSGKIKEYTYYHCTRKKRELNCSQRKHIRQEELEKQIEKELEKITILPKFLEWALEGLNKLNDREIEDRTKIYEMQHKSLVDTQSQLDELTKMRYKMLIGDDEYLKEKEILQKQIIQLKDNLRQTESRAEKWIELTEKTFNFAAYARKDFLFGDVNRKKEILMALGQNPTILDGKLTIQANEWLVPIEKGYPALKEEYERLELDKLPFNKAKTEALASVRANWLGR